MSPATCRFSHIAISVADLPRATAFYAEAFNFGPGRPYAAAGRKVAALMEADARGLEAVFLRLGPVLLELIQHASPQPRDMTPRPAVEVGLAHLSFVVDDLTETVRRLESWGGRMRTRMRYEFAPGQATEIAFATDPDGNRIELIFHPDDAAADAHAKFLGLEGLGWPGAR
jgi:catechol 2,3-dioxygenase-like lactoylglutathione lyase family enzyme